MTITFWAPDGVEVTAKQYRQAQAAQHGGGAGKRLGGRSGFRVDTPADVLTVTSTTWTLKPCAAMIDGDRVSNQGMYGWASDANETGSIQPAHDTYGRIDRLSIELLDDTAGDGTGQVSAELVYTVGAATATPQAPNYPGFLVGTITVPVLGGGDPTVVLNPARYVAAGAALPVSSLTERDEIPDLYTGFRVQRKDVTGSPVETRHGSTWYRQPISVEHGLAVSDGFFTITGGLIKTVTAGLTQVTATLRMVRGTGSITVNPSDSTLVLNLIPAGFRPPVNAQFVASVNNAVGERYAEPVLIVNSGGTLVGRSVSGGPITISTGYEIYISASWFI